MHWHFFSLCKANRVLFCCSGEAAMGSSYSQVLPPNKTDHFKNHLSSVVEMKREHAQEKRAICDQHHRPRQQRLGSTQPASSWQYLPSNNSGALSAQPLSPPSTSSFHDNPRVQHLQDTDSNCDSDDTFYLNPSVVWKEFVLAYRQSTMAAFEDFWSEITRALLLLVIWINY